MHSPGRGQAVDHQIERAHLRTDFFEGLPFAFVRERVAVDACRPQSSFTRQTLESDTVVIARRSGPLPLGRSLIEDAERLGAESPGGGNPCCQPVTGRTSDHENVLRAGGTRGLGPLDGFDLLFNAAGTALRMRIDTNETSGSLFDDLFGHGPGPEKKPLLWADAAGWAGPETGARLQPSAVSAPGLAKHLRS